MSLSNSAFKAMKSGAFPKFCATVSDDGVPNVVPLLSAQLVDNDTLAFVRLMVWKTRRNFEANKKLSFGCIGPGGKTFIARGEFSEWVTKGPVLEKFNDTAIYRYNAYSGANMAGVVKLLAVDEFPGMGLIKNLIAKKPAASRGQGPMPVQVLEKWGLRAAIKALGMLDSSGFPLAIPHQGVYALDSGTLAFEMPAASNHPLSSLQPGAPLSASVLSLLPAAYQVKGKFAGTTGNGAPLGRLEISEVFCASMPLPGKRIFPVESYE